MKILSIEKSLEDCQQVRGQGYDLHMSRAVMEEDIEKWRGLGDMIYMKQLRRPFFKISSRQYIIRGFLGSSTVRIGCSREFDGIQTVKQAEIFLGLCENENIMP